LDASEELDRKVEDEEAENNLSEDMNFDDDADDQGRNAEKRGRNGKKDKTGIRKDQTGNIEETAELEVEEAGNLVNKDLNFDNDVSEVDQTTPKKKKKYKGGKQVDGSHLDALKNEVENLEHLVDSLDERVDELEGMDLQHKKFSQKSKVGKKKDKEGVKGKKEDLDVVEIHEEIEELDNLVDSLVDDGRELDAKSPKNPGRRSKNGRSKCDKARKSEEDNGIELEEDDEEKATDRSLHKNHDKKLKNQGGMKGKKGKRKNSKVADVTDEEELVAKDVEDQDSENDNVAQDSPNKRKHGRKGHGKKGRNGKDEVQELVDALTEELTGGDETSAEESEKQGRQDQERRRKHGRRGRERRDTELESETGTIEDSLLEDLLEMGEKVDQAKWEKKEQKRMPRHTRKRWKA